MSFDIFNQAEFPYIVLCNPNKDELYSLEQGYNYNIRTRFNALSELTFEFPERAVNGETVFPAYALLKSKRLIKVEGYGYFIVDGVEENEDGTVPIKNIHAVSLEGELISKKITVFGGTYPLYDILSPGDSLLGTLLEYLPLWSVGTVDAELLTKFRTFDVSDTTIYGFLMTQVEEAYNCIFLFDSENRTISAHTIDNATTETDVYLSFDNLIQRLSLKEISDELITSLKVYGAGNLDIRTVNPLGTVNIYNFDYFKTTDWMSQGLIDAINVWEALIASYQTTYANTLTLLKSANSDLVTLNIALEELQAEWDALEGVQKVRIEQHVDYSDILYLMGLKETEINYKEVEVQSKEFEIETLTTTLVEINDLLSFDNNFTVSQLSELSTFIFESTYQNENIVQLDSMTPDEIQEQAQYLYDQSVIILGKVSQPRYEINIDATNYLTLIDYQNFINATDVGAEISIELGNGTIATLALLEISQSFDNPDDFSMTFSNRLRLDNGSFVYSDLMGKSVKTGNSVSFNSVAWSNWEVGYKNDVSSFINSSLDTSRNKLINSTNEEITIGANGLRGRIYDPDTETYSNSQVWLTSNTLAFTRDNWTSAALAIGEVEVGEGRYIGLVAEAIVGRIIAGESLVIQNEGLNFVLDSTGAYLRDATFQVSNDFSRVLINPADGISIYQNVGGTWVKKFYADASGNVVFSGDLSGASGYFSGEIYATVGNIGWLIIDEYGLRTIDSVNYLRGDGTLKWGGLSITPYSATFTGTIYADRLVGQITTPQIANSAVTDPILGSGLNAGKITFGSMSGGRIYSGTIGGPGISIQLSSTGVPTIYGTSTVTLSSGAGGWLEVSSYAYLRAPGTVYIEGATIDLQTTRLKIYGRDAHSVTIPVQTPSGSRLALEFQEGILVNYYYY